MSGRARSRSVMRPASGAAAAKAARMLSVGEIIDRVLAGETTASSNSQYLFPVNDKTQPSLTHSISEETVLTLIQTGRAIFGGQPMMIEVEPPLQVCGDIHGQYTDLLRLFHCIGWPPDKSYLWLGDYVDRGRQQLETIILLTAYKCKYPEQFFMLRGNHECTSINTDLFNMMPLTALIGGRILCMHGGLSPDITSWADLRNIKRPLEVGEAGLAADLLWSDPNDNVIGWESNSRGISHVFGPDVVLNFVDQMDLDLIARYCGEFDNNAATMTVGPGLVCSFQVLKPKDMRIKVPKTKTGEKAKEKIAKTHYPGHARTSEE